MSEHDSQPSRRKFIRSSLLGTAALTSGLVVGRAAEQGDSQSEDNEKEGKSSDIVAPAQGKSSRRTKAALSRQHAVPQMSQTFEKLYSHILEIPAFNHHLHFGDEKSTLAWYHPKKTIGQTEFSSQGIVPGLLQLLDMPGDKINPETSEEISERFAKLVTEKSKKEFYDKLSSQTNTSHILFMVFAYQLDRAKELISDRFRFAIYIDHFLFPLDNSTIKSQHPGYNNRLNSLEASFAFEEKHLGPRPKKFSQYLQFITQAITTHIHRPGVIGAKIGFSYWRTFDVEPVDINDAQRIYEDADTSPEAYKKLQDFLVFYLLQVCGELKLPLQIHTGLGADSGLVLKHTNPALLDHVLSRPEIESSRVILIHGGYPFCKEIGVMARRKNVCLDFSWMPLLLPPNRLAGYLQEWFEFVGPYKMIFGVDGSGLSMIAGTWCARRAITIALTNMVEEGQITEVEAVAWARAVLHGNAMRLYKKES